MLQTRPVVGQEPGWRLLRWNEVETPITTFRVGGAALVDYGSFLQDDASREHFDLTQNVKFRDTRFLFRGRLKTKRDISWQAGIMYDIPKDEWLIRQTGFVVAVPEAWGHFWIGRTKEGISLNRVMVGYDGWTTERFTFSDASIPLLADGIKWMGYLPNRRLLWNLGVFVDWLSEGQTFSSYDHQVAARVAWVTMDSASSGSLLHIGLALRLGEANNDSLQLRSKPEASTAPNFVDTGKFPAKWSGLVGLEAFYRPGSWLFGGEYYVQKVDAARGEVSSAPDTPGALEKGIPPQLRFALSAQNQGGAKAQPTGNPIFHGGEIFTSWLITGETRPYSTVGGYFRAVSPAKGGPGTLEAVLRLSYIDLNSAGLEGGKFWRLTPMINFHLTSNVRLELAYGYGSLQRFGATSATQFFQSRLQVQL